MTTPHLPTTPTPPSAPVASPQTPLLEALHARIAIDDVVALEDFTLVTRGDRVLFVGEVGVLFAALSGVPLLAITPPDNPATEPPLTGEARVVSGELRLHGHDVALQTHLAVSGFAPLDPPVPSTMTTLAYVTWAARLAGVPPRAAAELANATLRRAGLERASTRPAASLALPERRVLQLAKAAVHQPAVLIAEAPLDRLEGPAATFVAAALAALTEGRRALLSARRIDPATAEAALPRAATHLVFMGDTGVLAEGPPDTLTAEARVYRLTVPTNAEPLRAALAARGLTLTAGPTSFTVTLPEGTTTATLLQAASEARAPIIELAPLLPT